MHYESIVSVFNMLVERGSVHKQPKEVDGAVQEFKVEKQIVIMAEENTKICNRQIALEVGGSQWKEL